MKQNFKTRQPLERILQISPSEDLNEITEVLNKLAELGWDFNQWGCTKERFKKEDLLAAFPSYETEAKDVQDHMWNDFYASLADIFFIESFGNKEHGYIRAEKPSILLCAIDCLKKAEKKVGCLEHEWDYTHNNGFKTCSKCNTFTACSVDEAVANYVFGSVDVKKGVLSLYFHNERALCECGSKQLFYHDCSMFYDKTYQCPKCSVFHPMRFNNSGNFSYNFSPYDEKYLTGALVPTDRLLDQHQMFSIGLVNRDFIQQQILKYIGKMYDHFVVVERREGMDEFVSWVSSYVIDFVKNSEEQIKEDDVFFNVVGLSDLVIEWSDNKFDVSYELLLSKADEGVRTAEEQLSAVIGALVDKKKDK